MAMAEANPQINLEDVPRLDDVTFLPVSRKYFRMRMAFWGVVQLMTFGAVMSPFVARAFVDDGRLDEFTGWWWPLAALVTWAALWFLEEWKGFERRGYAVREHDVTYRTGWFFRNTTTVPFGMIQHSELSQGPISRALGLNHLKIFTAGGSGNLRIAGLDEEEAQQLRSVIEVRTQR